MSHVPQIAVIGAGQLGSRHLQALARLDRRATVTVVEPFAEARERAKQRFAEVATADGLVELVLGDSFAALPTALDAVIVATNADRRADVVRQLLDRATVRFLILEKVLFQRDDDYVAIGDRLAAAGVKTWVNCPRRMQPGYQQLRQELRDQTPFAMRVTGSGWGLACNGIHFLDLAALLASRDDLQIAEADLSSNVVPSKRAGFVELFGRVRGAFGDGSTIELVCPTEAVEPIAMDLETAQLRIAIREDRQEVRIGSRTGDEPERIVPLPPVYQSQLSQLVVQDLLDRGDCALTPYAESCRLHRPFLAALLAHYRRHVDVAATVCPIT